VVQVPPAFGRRCIPPGGVNRRTRRRRGRLTRGCLWGCDTRGRRVDEDHLNTARLEDLEDRKPDDSALPRFADERRKLAESAEQDGDRTPAANPLHRRTQW